MTILNIKMNKKITNKYKLIKILMYKKLLVMIGNGKEGISEE